MVSDTRTGDAFIRFASQYPDKHHALLRRLLGAELARAVVVATLGIAVVLLLPISRSWTTWVLIFSPGISGVAALCSSVLVFHRHWRLLAACKVISNAGMFAATAFALAQLGPTGYLWGYMVGQLLLLVLLAISVRRRSPSGGLGSNDSSTPSRRELVRFTLGASLTTTAAAGGDQLIMLSAAGFVGPTLVANLRVGLAPGRMLAAIASPVATLLHPELARLSVEKERARLREILSRASLWTGSASLIAALGFIPIAPYFIKLVYGAEYSGMTSAMQILTLAAALRQSAPWSKVLASALGRPLARVVPISLEALASVAIVYLLGERGSTAVALGLGTVFLVITSYWLTLAFFFASELRQEDSKLA